MASRVGLVAVIVLLAAVAVAPAARQPPSGTAVYVVRVDPRLCPSPQCGGYWVALANHARTQCADDLLRPRCYVASAIEPDRGPVSVADGALVRGSVRPRSDELGLLLVKAAFTPAGTARPTGRYYRLVDTGIRCVRAPCFSMRAALLNRAASTTVSGLVLTTLNYDRRLEERVLAALGTKSGVLVRGEIVRNPGGRELHASRFYLRSNG